MFLQEFEQSRGGMTHKIKKAKKEYSAGFKNYHPNKPYNNESSVQNTSAQSDIFDQLKIGNLKQLYLKSQPVVNHQKEIIQAQEKSIKRLISRPEKKEQQKQQHAEDINSENQHRFPEIYHKVANFQQTANAVLLKAQFKKIQEKLKSKHNEHFKENQFINSLLKFIMMKHKTISSKKLSNDELFLEYSNFLNEKQNQKYKDQLIKKSQLEEFIGKSMYLYARFDLSKSNNQEISIQNLHELLRSDKQIDKIGNDAHLLQLLNKKFTVPYESSLYKEEKSSIIDQMNKKDPQIIEQKYVFNANPVPKTTYQKPKERPKSAQKIKTITEPFHLTEYHKQQKKMEDYYKWDRNFHARQIPKTTYEAYFINSLEEAQKKKRMSELLKSAAYPSTMKYLENYNEHVQKKDRNLKEKYTKKHNMSKTGEKIPNFQQIHKKQVTNLQNRKAENRHITKPQPFQLSQSRPKKQREQLQTTDLIEAYHKQERTNHTKSANRLQPQSTLKFQTYVNLRKKEKQQKQELKLQQKRKQQKFNAQRKIYKQILKQRMEQELHNIPKTHINPQPLTNNVVKVNLQKIYFNEPLLIERESQKCKKPSPSNIKNWDPII